MTEQTGPQKGEKWTIGSFTDLTFVGMGRDFSQDKYFIFEDPVNGYFIITKDDFYAPDVACLKDALEADDFEPYSDFRRDELGM